MRFAASAVVLGGPGWRERLGEIRAAGIDLLELWAAFGPDAQEGVTFGYTDPLEVEAVAAELHSAGMKVHSLHGPMLVGGPSEVGPFGPAGLEGLLEAERAAIDAVAALGGRFVVTQDAAERAPEDAPHLVSREALEPLAEYALAHRCVFCVENGAEDPAGFERLVELVKSLRHPALGICLDVGHAQAWAYADAPRAIAAAGSAIRSCHIHDNMGVSDSHLVVGDGILPWHAVLASLAEAGYRGPLVIESWGGGSRGTPTQVLARSATLLRSVAGPEWTPHLQAADHEVFFATAADRERAALVIGGVPRRAGSRSAIVVDRFGEPAAWAELEPAASAAGFVLFSRPGVPPEALAAAAGCLLGEPGAPDVVRADGDAVRTLEALGFVAGPDGLLRRSGRGGGPPWTP